MASKTILAAVNLALAVAALWLGMSIPSYFRSVSELVLKAAAEGSPGLREQARDELRSGRPGLGRALLAVGGVRPADPELQQLEDDAAAILNERPAYRWSGGPAPFYEQFLASTDALREDEAAVIPTLLPQENRAWLLEFLRQSPNQHVQAILDTRALGGWQRFYPVYSTAGHPLDASILTSALLEQAAAIPPQIRKALLAEIEAVERGDGRALASLEAIYIAVLTLGRHADWVQLKTIVGSLDSVHQLLFCAHAIQQDPERLGLMLAALMNTLSPQELVDYLNRHGERGWAGVQVALPLGRGALAALLEFDKPVYQPPAIWKALPAALRDSQQAFMGFAEGAPGLAILVRLLAFGLCGSFLVGILRILILGLHPGGGHERRILINIDSLVGAVLVTMLVWILIEPGLMDFRPNEQGTLQIKLAQVLPETTPSLTETAPTAMIDQVTILVLLLFFVAQLLVFVFGLLKIVEVRRQEVSPEVKLQLLDNEENLFDLGLYVGLGGTVGSLILVVLNVVTLFGIIFVAILKVGFLRPYRRQLILQKN